MPTLYIQNNFSLNSQGNVKSGKQGDILSSVLDPLAVTVVGQTHSVTGALATASAVTVYDDDDDVPADWVYLYFWADQDCYLQLIVAGASCVFKVKALQPFVLPGFDAILPAASATPIAGGAEPVPLDIDSVVIGNYSGSTLNYVFSVVN